MEPLISQFIINHASHYLPSYVTQKLKKAMRTLLRLEPPYLDPSLLNLSVEELKRRKLSEQVMEQILLIHSLSAQEKEQVYQEMVLRKLSEQVRQEQARQESHIKGWVKKALLEHFLGELEALRYRWYRERQPKAWIEFKTAIHILDMLKARIQVEIENAKLSKKSTVARRKK